METTSLSKSINGIGETYAYWMRGMFAKIASEKRDAISLLGSMVSEPLDLLRSLVGRNFTETLTPCYQSVISTNNRCLGSAISKRYGVSEDSILCNTGVMAGLSFLYRVFLNPGDRVLVEEPGFDIFWDFATSVGAEVDFFERPAPLFQIDPDAVLARIGPKTRMIVLSNLHNPSGALLSEETIAHLAEGAKAHNVFVVVDEVYRDYADLETNGRNLTGSNSNIIRLGSLTKIYGLSTLRCGWIIADPQIIRVLDEAYFKFEFNNSKLTHAIASHLLDAPEGFDNHVREQVAQSRDMAVEGFSSMAAKGLIEFEMPDHGCTFFPKIIGVENTRRFAEWLIEEKGVYTVPGEFYRTPGFLRLSLVVEPTKLSKAIDRLSDGIEEYRRI